MPVIEVEHLTKEYRLGALQSLKQTMLNAGARLFGRPIPEHPLFKALDDVNFCIEQGEVVGIIGHNGAGKSTLLKMLARISTPTRGSVTVRGRIAPLIEVGAGFVPEFTGRENVYLNGTILGMSRREIDRKFDAIVEFAEMNEFIDTPVKRYSSGMQVKLAFAVATSNEAEVLIVDEVLAVGDIAFQRKCFDRIESLIRSTGQTVIVVSHNIRQIERLCSRVLHLSHGQLINDGLPAHVCNEYYELMDKRIHEQFSQKTNSQVLASGEIELLDAFVSNEDQATPATVVDFRRPIDIHVRLHVNTPVPKADIAFGFHTTDMLYVTTFNTVGSGIPVDIPEGTVQIKCRVRDMRLLPRVYGLRIGICDQRSRPVWYSDNVCSFSVRSGDRSRSLLSQYSLVDLDVDWTINGINIEQSDNPTYRTPTLNQPA